jgi:hypothetical protein
MLRHVPVPRRSIRPLVPAVRFVVRPLDRQGIANANTVIKTTIVSHHAGDRDADTDSPHAAQETSR